MDKKGLLIETIFRYAIKLLLQEREESNMMLYYTNT